jgi:hypothetical protein
LHCERQEDKENFISECIRLMEDGDCDLKECRFLFEDICKMISPAKPEYDYFLTLRKARSMEDFIPGRTNKAPIPNKGFGGKTMEHVNKKILMETGLDSSVALELLIANKIVEFNLPIVQVVEQVWWPYVYKQNNPESFEIPAISKDDSNRLQPMEVVFRIAGLDGEATEERIESLTDGNEPTSDAEI